MNKKVLIILVLVVVIIVIASHIVFVRKESHSNSISMVSTTTMGSSLDTSDLKTFTFDNFHGSFDISEKFRFQYPASWYNEGQYFSPQKIQFYDLYSVKAPIYFDLILTDIFNQTEFKYQIDHSKRGTPDTVGQIDGKVFKRYNLIDYGTYGGDSAGRLKIFVGPKIKINSHDYYLVFHWEEAPLAEFMASNDIKVFDNMLLTLKFFH